MSGGVTGKTHCGESTQSHQHQRPDLLHKHPPPQTHITFIMSDNPLMGLAETIQTASIKRHPSPTHDINPSTAASKVEPVTIDTSPDSSDIEGAESDEIPVSVLRPVPRQSQLPPLPDLRFEQSYLASIKDAQSWQAVTYITLRDQVGTYGRDIR